jgi:hypothetical protein
MTNNKQQTAVEWLIEQLNSKYGGNDFLITHINEIGKAKEMDKEQMDKVAEDWWNEGARSAYDGKRKYESFEQYYEQTYGGGEK